MSAPALATPAGRALTIRGRPYPVLLPKLSDARLHLAAVIISLQVLGQVAFDFRLSIAQILIAIGTCAVLEIGIAFFRQHVLMWPASAMLTGNGVAFVLRVPGTQHGDWWSLHGWYIFAGTAAVSLALEVPDQVPRLAHLQPVELRARPLLPAARPGARRAARLLVGADVGMARARARDHRRRRPGDPRPAAPDRDRGRLLADLRGRARGADGLRPRVHRALAPRPGHRPLLLVGAGHLAGGAGLPVLHDHRPEDDAEVDARSGRLRGLDRPARRAPDRAGEDRVLGEGRAPRRARDRLRRAAAARARARHPPRPARARRARRRRARRLHGRDRGGRDPGTARDQCGAARTHGAASPGDDPAVAPGPDGAQAEDGTPDRSRPRRRPPDADRGPDRATTGRARPRLRSATN